MAEDDPKGGIRQKLVETKQAWARAGRLLTGQHGDPERDRLPPGQRLVKDFPVLDLGIQPQVPTATLRLDLDGLVEQTVSLGWDELQALPQQAWVNDIHCVTQWSRYDNHWQGIPIQALLERARPLPSAHYVMLHAHDGYTTNLPLADLDRPDVLLAHHWEGAPLDRVHGGPLRLVVPHLYLWKSPKWISRIHFMAEDELGFWEERGYHRRGDPWAEERYG